MRFTLKSAVVTGTLVALAAFAGPSRGDPSRTLIGNYVADDDSGPLEAFFSPDEDGAWQVDFRFNFQGQPLTFSGFAEGSLSDGALEGIAYNERGNRTFTFKGRFEQGKFRGTHAEIENGIEYPTGTLTLEPPPS